MHWTRVGQIVKGKTSLTLSAGNVRRVSSSCNPISPGYEDTTLAGSIFRRTIVTLPTAVFPRSRKPSSIHAQLFLPCLYAGVEQRDFLTSFRGSRAIVALTCSDYSLNMTDTSYRDDCRHLGRYVQCALAVRCCIRTFDNIRSNRLRAHKRAVWLHAMTVYSRAVMSFGVTLYPRCVNKAAASDFLTISRCPRSTRPSSSMYSSVVIVPTEFLSIRSCIRP